MNYVALSIKSIFRFRNPDFLPFDVKHEIAIAKLWRFSVDFLVDMHIIEPIGHLVVSQVSASSLVGRSQIVATNNEI